MRIAGSVLLAIVATVLGLAGALMLGVSGLSLAGPGLIVIEYSDSDDFERAIGIGLGIGALVGWLLVLCAAVFVGLRGDDPPSRGRRVTVWVVAALSAVLTLGLLTAVLSTPPPVYEDLSPEWNRASSQT